MTQLIGITAIALMLAMLLKNINHAFSVVVIVCASCLLFGKVIGSLSQIIAGIKSISAGSGETAAYIDLMIKTLGIALISQFIADICRDSGENALAGQTEVATKILIITMILPLFEAVIKAISGLLI